MTESNPERIEVLGRELRCHVCANDRFIKREAQLNTAAASFFNFDWTNASGICAICCNCGFIHSFFPLDDLPTEPPDQDV